MKRLTLEATDENILNSIKTNAYNRNNDVKDFIEALDTIEGNMFISLDARWGEGKTFYVRQVEKTLEFVTKRTWEISESGIVDDLKPYFQNTVLNSIVLDKSYLPIYYNAWLYDNHTDPLMSLLLTIIKKRKQYIDTKVEEGIGNRIITLLSAASVSISGTKFQFSVDTDKLKSAFTGEDILESVKTAEEIRELVKGILNDVIVEKVQKLVIIIDELDRCKPSYAIEMLEHIKHYFGDERIIFIVSVNKEQLVHTISKYYGSGFDSTGYLNKFFDLNVHMPVEFSKDSLVQSCVGQQFHLWAIVNDLSEYYRLSLRDSLIFRHRVSNLPTSYVNDITAQGCFLSLFIPIIAILDMKDENEKEKFLYGNSDVLEEFSRRIPAINNMIRRFGDDEFEAGFRKIKVVYEFVFKNTRQDDYEQFLLCVSCDFKKICMRLCNGFIR